MLEFVDSDLYFVKDKNNFINPLLQVRSGYGSSSPKYNLAVLKNVDTNQRNNC